MVARTAGSFLGGIFNNPGIIILGGLAIALFFFAPGIQKAFADFGKNFGKIELPPFPEFPPFPELPPFPEFPNLCSLFGIGCNGDNGEPEPPQPPGDLPFPPDVEDTGLLTQQERDACKCGTNIIQDIMGDVSETCIQCPDIPPDDPGDGGFIGPTQPPEPCVEVPLIQGGSFNTCTGVVTPPPNGGFIGPPEPPEPTFEPPVILPPGFEGGGPSFEGGTIFETDICNKSIGQIASEFGISASAAVDMKFQACETSDFDFGTNTGSGFGPGDDQTGGIVTGGATLESEEQKAACVTCEMFGLNCPLCAGTI